MVFVRGHLRVHRSYHQRLKLLKHHRHLTLCEGVGVMKVNSGRVGINGGRTLEAAGLVDSSSSQRRTAGFM